jgi:hypothetical protein
MRLRAGPDPPGPARRPGVSAAIMRGTDGVAYFSDAWVTAWIRRRTAHWQGLVANVSEESLEDYTDRVILSSWLKNFEPPIDPGLAERAGYYIRRGLELLDAIPRDHPFWDKTNNKATEYKASLWFWQVLEANPDDAEARWIVAALKLQRCGTQLEALLAPLVLDDPSNLRWLVGATVCVEYLSGADYTAALRHELTMLNNNPAVRSLMQAPAGNDELGRAVQIARSVLAGNSIFEAVEGLTGQ